MIFTELRFVLFFLVVLAVHWALRSHGARKNWLLVTSYVFYGAWDWRFLFLMAGSTALDYFCGLWLGSTDDPRRRRFAMALSLVGNLGSLALFKYYDFFVESAASLLRSIGFEADTHTLGLVLPAGISFYTFQTLSYTIDVYRRELPVARNFRDFALFVSFFPQLVAGPIVRASDFLPQLDQQSRLADARFRALLFLFLAGFVKKACIADNLAAAIDPVFADPGAHSPSTLWLAAAGYYTQIYCDFSGYSDMAIATAGMLGYRLPINFAFPMLATSITTAWRRWHISLSTWFRDYLYIPLGGNRGSKAFVVRNTMIIFVVSGFWHGANWTFVAWGALNALFFLPLVLRNTHRSMTGTVAEGRMLPSLREVGMMAVTFALTCFAWIFFRARSMGEAFAVIERILSGSLFSMPELVAPRILAYSALGVGVTVVLEWINRERQHGLQMDGRGARPLRYALYYGLIAIIIVCAPLGGGEFIYFQF